MARDPFEPTTREQDETGVMDRADTIYWEPPVVREPFWRADDPETGCIGVGETEREARGNLVYAVRAHRRTTESDRSFFSAGPHQTVPITWRRKSRLRSMADRLLKLFV